MLENKRKHSVFLEENKEQNVASDKSDPNLKQVDRINEVNPVSEKEQRMKELMNTTKTPNNSKKLGRENRTHSLFFAPETEKRDFQTVLKEVQEYIAGNYSCSYYQ